MSGPGDCKICLTLPPGDLIELDSLMGDPSRWPKTVWGIFNPPKGRLPPSYMRFGAMGVGRAFLAEKGHKFDDGTLRKHYRYDVVVIATNPAELVARGIIKSDNHRALADPSTLDPAAFLTYFDKGIRLGIRGLELMEKRVEEAVLAGDPIPISTLTKIADLGAKLSITQASIRARGQSLGAEGDEEEGFRAGSAPLPSARMGHARIRIVGDEARPVKDEGPADRARYSEVSAMDGGPGLPHR